VTQQIPTIIIAEHNGALMRLVSYEEVDQTIKEMPPQKAPGSDGFTINFFNHYWPMIKEEVWQLVEESRTSGQVLSGLDSTFLTLIPKQKHITNPNQFRPIALYNVIYKIITKVIALSSKVLKFSNNKY
jgi:hypothetical protein